MPICCAVCLRQHHQPAYAGGGARRILPVGFLVADRGQQAPVKTELVRGIHEIWLQFLQPVVIAVDEAACFHVIELVRKHIHLLDQVGQLALAPDMVVKLPDRPDEGIILHGPPDGPAQGFGIRTGRRQPEVPVGRCASRPLRWTRPRHREFPRTRSSPAVQGRPCPRA